MVKRCVFLTALHLAETVRISNLFATCSPVLARLYRHFGFSALPGAICKEAEGPFQLIHASAPTALLALASNEEERSHAKRKLAMAMPS